MAEGEHGGKMREKARTDRKDSSKQRSERIKVMCCTSDMDPSTHKATQ
jgi:hypothetical protein